MIDFLVQLWAKITALGWAVWIAFIACIVGLGAFLDEYYVGDETKDKVRNHAIRLVARLQKSSKGLNEIISPSILRYILLGFVLVIGCTYFTKYTPTSDILVIASVMFAIFAVCLGAIIAPFLVILVALFPYVFWWVGVASYKIVNLILSVIFKPAADPRRSPFKFLTAMVGLWILVAKLAIEFFK